MRNWGGSPGNETLICAWGFNVSCPSFTSSSLQNVKSISIELSVEYRPNEEPIYASSNSDNGADSEIPTRLWKTLIIGSDKLSFVNDLKKNVWKTFASFFNGTIINEDIAQNSETRNFQKMVKTMDWVCGSFGEMLFVALYLDFQYFSLKLSLLISTDKTSLLTIPWTFETVFSFNWMSKIQTSRVEQLKNLSVQAFSHFKGAPRIEGDPLTDFSAIEPVFVSFVDTVPTVPSDRLENLAPPPPQPIVVNIMIIIEILIILEVDTMIDMMIMNILEKDMIEIIMVEIGFRHLIL